MDWLNRMNVALEWIDQNLKERLDIEKVAKAAYSSPFHFQRMFYMLTGISVAEYARKRRLTLAAQELAMSSDRVLDIALKYGYDSPEAFAKAFKKIHGISPSEARNPGVQLKAYPRISFKLSLKGDQDMDYRIEKKMGFTVVGKSFQTSCENQQNSREIPMFWGGANADGTTDKLCSISSDGNVMGIILDATPGKDEFTYMIAAKVDEPDGASVPEAYTSRQIPETTWAIFTSVGPMPGAIQSVFNRIYQEWFPATGYEHAGTPEMEVYPPGDVTSEAYRCEVWIPIKH